MAVALAEVAGYQLDGPMTSDVAGAAAADIEALTAQPEAPVISVERPSLLAAVRSTVMEQTVDTATGAAAQLGANVFTSAI